MSSHRSRARCGSVVLTTVIAMSAAGSAPVASAAGCAEVFSADFAAQLALDFPGQRVTASVVDTRTGCRHDLHPGLQITTASVIKAAVLGAVLLEAQDERRDLTAAERADISPMITYSHNNPHVSDLIAGVGGTAGMDRFDRRMGVTATRNSSSYGATTTTARDRTAISMRMLHGGGPLSTSSREKAWQAMSSVHPTQRWGISAGVPVRWSVALKNGFYPMRGNGWRVGSTGFVRYDGGGGYAVTVLTDRSASQEAGMHLVEVVSQQVAATIAGGTAAPRTVDRSVCVTTTAGESWPAVSSRLGLSPRQAPVVRKVSGGNPAPLQGQRACYPWLGR